MLNRVNFQSFAGTCDLGLLRRPRVGRPARRIEVGMKFGF